MQRSKINDEFQFHERIDLTPYKVDYLNDPQGEWASDMFELVGVLVHSGTAESGHYYSYIKERPTGSSQASSWIEYNDSDVTEFDPAKIPDHCFGGWNDPMQNNGYPLGRFHKVWNAYMLFYQRVSETKTFEFDVPREASHPIRLPLPPVTENHIALENEGLIQQYCLMDPNHALFIRCLLEKVRSFNDGVCSETHELESQTICLALEHIDQTTSKSKDLPELDNTLAFFTQSMSRCVHCCADALRWICKPDHFDAIRSLLLKNTTPKVRIDMSKFIFAALSHMRALVQNAIEEETKDENDLKDLYVDNVRRLVRTLKELQDVIYYHARSWDNFYGLVADIASLGTVECQSLLQNGFFSTCLEYLVVENVNDRWLRNQYAQYMRFVEKGRKFQFGRMINLFSIMLQEMLVDTVEDEDSYHLTSEDSSLLQASETSRNGSWRPIFLDKILSSSHAPADAAMIIEILLDRDFKLGADSTDTNFNSGIFEVLVNGIVMDPAELAKPYLTAGIVYAEQSWDHARVKAFVIRVAKEVSSIGRSGGREHIEFFRQVSQAHNKHVPNDGLFLHNLVTQSATAWAPLLLCYHEREVRIETLALLEKLVLEYANSTDDEEVDQDVVHVFQDLAMSVCRKCMDRVDSHIIRNGYHVETRLVEQIVQVINHCLQHFTDEDSAEDRIALEKWPRKFNFPTTFNISSLIVVHRLAREVELSSHRKRCRHTFR